MNLQGYFKVKSQLIFELVREDIQKKNRKISFDLPTESNNDKVNTDLGYSKNSNTSPPRYHNETYHENDVHFPEAIPNYKNYQTIARQRQDNNVMREQQKIIEIMRKQIEDLKIQQQRNEQYQQNSYYGGARPKINRTYTVRNLYPEQFAIQINPSRQQTFYDPPQRRPNNWNNYQPESDFQSNTRYPTRNTSQQPRTQLNFLSYQNNFQSRKTNNFQYQPRFPSNNRINNTSNERQLQYNQRSDRQDQKRHLITCPYCGSNERHDWSECGKTKNTYNNRNQNQQNSLRKETTLIQGN